MPNSPVYRQILKQNCSVRDRSVSFYFEFYYIVYIFVVVNNLYYL